MGPGRGLFLGVGGEQQAGGSVGYPGGVGVTGVGVRLGVRGHTLGRPWGVR